MVELEEKTCTECDSTNIKRVVENKEIKVKNEFFNVEEKYWHCNDCEVDWRVFGEHDYIEEAFRKYREKHSLLQPEEIKDLRKKYKLTQGELSKIFGWGAVTLTRYENGALQNKANDNFLRLLESPKSFYDYIKNKPDFPEKEKYLDLINLSMSRTFIEEALPDFCDEFTGFLEPSADKIKNVILFLCKDGTLITKLNKLLYYVDNKYFKEFMIGITGLRYQHYDMGPVPENYNDILNSLVKTKALELKEVPTGEHVGIEYTNLDEPDMSLFNEDEIKILNEIKEKFKHSSSGWISNKSHEETGYKKTQRNEFISYTYAKDLSV